MASVATEKYIMPEEYLSAERRAKIKSEYIYGEIFAMSRVGSAHNLIILRCQDPVPLGRDVDTAKNLTLRCNVKAM